MSKSKVFVLGAGFIGKPLTVHLKNLDYSVQASVRNPENAKNIEDQGIEVHTFSVGDVLSPINHFSCDVLVICYPIGSRSKPIGSHLTQAAWIAKYFPSDKLKQVVLASSTSVYPDGFGLVNEDLTERPAGNGLIQLEYEEALKQAYGKKLTILRLAGLVGEQRLPGRFLAGKTDLPNAESPVNMVHQTDVVRFFLSAIQQAVVGQVFNLCHDQHPTRKDYYTNAALALGLTPPIFSSNQIQEPKVVDNTKSKTFFGLNYVAAIV
jgi:nucleoside-diphosphate-sugar epimerase